MKFQILYLVNLSPRPRVDFDIMCLPNVIKASCFLEIRQLSKIYCRTIHVYLVQICILMRKILSTVYFIYVCQTLFGNNFFYFFLFQDETFFMYSETKSQLDPTTIDNFPHRRPLLKIAHFGNVMSLDYRHDVAKVSGFHNRGLWGNSMAFVGSN